MGIKEARCFFRHKFKQALNVKRALLYLDTTNRDQETL